MAKENGRAIGTAVAEKRSLPNSTSTWGLATRLWYQSGLVGAPALEAKTYKSSPSTSATRGFTRVSPDLAPVVVRSTMGAPAKPPPTLPSLARNSSMTPWLKSFISLMARRYPS